MSDILRSVMEEARAAAWRWRHKGSLAWEYGEEEPTGSSIHLFEVQALYDNRALLSRDKRAAENTLRDTIGEPLDVAQLLNSAAENLRSADKTEGRVEAAFRIAFKLDEIAKRLYSPATRPTGENHD